MKEDELAVFQAVGQTRIMKLEGKIKKTIGGTLYWNYKFFHKANTDRESRAKMRVLPEPLSGRGLFQLSSKSRLNVQLVRHQQSD